MYGFDTFTGIPESWAGFAKGAFAFSKDGDLPPVPGNVQLLKGLFRDTLPGFLDEHPNEVLSYASIDCDLYQGAIDALRLLRPRLRVGSVLHFHEIQHSSFDEANALWDLLREDAGVEIGNTTTTTAKEGLRLEVLQLHGLYEAALFRVVQV